MSCEFCWPTLITSPSPPLLGERVGVRGYSKRSIARAIERIVVCDSRLSLRRPPHPSLSPRSGGEGSLCLRVSLHGGRLRDLGGDGGAVEIVEARTGRGARELGR